MVIIAAGFLWKLINEKREASSLTEMLVAAEASETTPIKINAAKLRLLLESLLEKDAETRRQSIAKVLILAQATDGTDLDSRIADFAIKRPDLPLTTRELLIGKVLAKRNQTVILPSMLELASSSDQPTLVVCSLLAVRQSAGDESFSTFLNLVTSTRNNDIRTAAEINLEILLKKTRSIDPLKKQLETAKESNIKQDVQKTLKRLLDKCPSLTPAEP
jgi:hypothetical protein